MKKFLLTMVLMLGALSMTVTDAEAKRLGGGGSAGRQSGNVSRQAAPASPSSNQARPAAPAAGTPAAPPKPASPWKGIAAGLVGGALLGAMFSHFGMGGAMASALGSILPMILMAGLAFFLFRLYQNRKMAGSSTPAQAGYNPQYSPQSGPQSYSGNFDQTPAYGSGSTSTSALPEIGSKIDSSGFGANQSLSANQGSWTIPADFDVPAFLRSAKTYFIRLQAAWDRADINDIREFTSAEMFAEVKLQIHERGATANVTDVVSIDAELLGLEEVGNDYMASVKFTGMIRESENAPAEAFKEVWNLSKPLNGQGGWVLAGIQQIQA